MNFFKRLVGWFRGEPTPETSSPPAANLEKSAFDIPVPATVEEKAQKAVKESRPFDFLKETDPKSFLHDLLSIRPDAGDFTRAREQIVQELKRLAPPRRRSRANFKDAA